jgi:hypothetical protein
MLRSGAHRRNLARRYGSLSACHRRLQAWQRQGVWEPAFGGWLTFLAILDTQGKLDGSRAFLEGPSNGLRSDRRSFAPRQKGEADVASGGKGKRSTLPPLTGGRDSPSPLR